MKVFAFSLVLALVNTAGGSQTSSVIEPDLEVGIRQVNEGHLQEAVLTLDAVILKLKPQAASNTQDLVQAFVYKGVALVGLAQEEPAKASFREALQYDPWFRLTEDKFSARVIRVFEAARTGKSKSVLEPPSGVPKKAGLSGLAVAGIVGGALAIAGGAAVVAGGDAPAASVSTTTTTTLTPAPTTFVPTTRNGDPTATISLTSVTPAAGSTIICRGARGPCDGLSMSFMVSTTSTPNIGFNFFVEMFVQDGRRCLLSTTAGEPVPLGQASRSIVAINFSSECANAGTSLRTTTMRATLRIFRSGAVPDPLTQDFSGGYTIDYLQ